MISGIKCVKQIAADLDCTFLEVLPSFTDAEGHAYSALDVAGEYFRSGADKISIGSDAVATVQAFRARRDGRSVRIDSGQTIPIDTLRHGINAAGNAPGSDLGLTPGMQRSRRDTRTNGVC